MNGDSYSAREPGRFPREPYSGRGGDREDRRGDRDRDRERRRSRSPGHRRPRREVEGDTYSSSRDYREREREDRYSGRDRRGGDREWDRDRGSRRDNRRDDDDRRGHRDRDLFDDRRGRRGGDRNDRGERGDRDGGAGGGAGGGGRDRRRSASPPKKREPTPDLTNAVSVLERRRRLTQWDLKPPGYESVTAEQAKLSGMFPLPGAPRQQPMDPSKLQAFMATPGAIAPTASLKPSESRQAKRLIVSNLPPSAKEESVIGFFNLQLNGLNVVEGIDPCISASLSPNQGIALVEFRNATDATVALALDGITMDDSHKTSNGSANGGTEGLKIRRPKDYIVPTSGEEQAREPGVVSSVVPDSPNKICVSNIPLYLTDEQVTELLVAFGELKAFVLVKDRGAEESRGIAFCEYADPSSTDVAVEGLNGMELGDRHLKVQRASVGNTQASGLEMGVNAMSMLAGTATGLDESRVLQLLNMVTAEELIDNEEYEEIIEDVKEECSKYGKVIDIKIPRPTGGSRQVTGVGKIFVKFEDSAAATKALKTLAGRKFADRTVVTTYFSEESFDVGAW